VLVTATTMVLDAKLIIATVHYSIEHQCVILGVYVHHQILAHATQIALDRNAKTIIVMEQFITVHPYVLQTERALDRIVVPVTADTTVNDVKHGTVMEA